MKKILLLIGLCFFANMNGQQIGDIVWVDGMGGRDIDVGNSIALDTAGNVYTTGYFSNTCDFDPSSSTFNLTSNGGYDIFITKFDNRGNFIWVKSIGGGSDDVGYSIALDNENNIFFTGYFAGTVDFNPDVNVFNLTSDGGLDIFITKLNNNGEFVFAKKMGGPENDYAYAITLDSENNIYTTGGFGYTADFDPGTPVYTILGDTTNNKSSIFISKLDRNGDFNWAKPLPSNRANSWGKNLTTDKNGNLYITGMFSGTIDFDPSSFTSNLTANVYDIFVLKFDLSGNYIWAKSFFDVWNSGGEVCLGNSIKTDSKGNVLIAGDFYGVVDFDPSTSNYQMGEVNSNHNGFLVKLNQEGEFIWANTIRQIIDTNTIFLDNNCSSLVIENDDSAYVTGTFAGKTNFTFNNSVSNFLKSNGNNDILLAHYDTDGGFVSAKSFGGIGRDYGSGIALDQESNLYTIGSYNGTVNFETSNSDSNLTSNGNSDVFVNKFKNPLLATQQYELTNTTTT